MFVDYASTQRPNESVDGTFPALGGQFRYIDYTSDAFRLYFFAAANRGGGLAKCTNKTGKLAYR